MASIDDVRNYGSQPQMTTSLDRYPQNMKKIPGPNSRERRVDNGDPMNVGRIASLHHAPKRTKQTEDDYGRFAG
jgi:hypothetical protein